MIQQLLPKLGLICYASYLCCFLLCLVVQTWLIVCLIICHLMTNDDVEFIAKIDLIYLLCFTSLLILTLLLGGSDLAPLTPCNKQYSNYCKNRLNLFCILIVSCMVVVHASSSTVQSCFIPLLLLLVKITIFSLHWLAFQTSQLAFVII